MTGWDQDDGSSHCSGCGKDMEVIGPAFHGAGCSVDAAERREAKRRGKEIEREAVREMAADLRRCFSNPLDDYFMLVQAKHHGYDDEGMEDYE